MSKWEDSLKRANDKCPCENNQGLFVPNRQLSILVSLLLFLFFACFITGYFLGKKYMIELVSEQVTNDLRNNQLSYALLKDDNKNFDDDSNEQNLIVSHCEQRDDNVLLPITPVNENLTIAVEEKSNTMHYYAQLIGFGTEKAAHQFVQKLALKNIETMVKKHASKTAKGKLVYWYQVVTPAYVDRHSLELLVSRLEKEEKLKDTCISMC
jgi:hypothetical protein